MHRVDEGRRQLAVLTWKGSDAELLDQLRQGVPGVTARLYDRFSPDINRVVWKVLGADADHDDLVHDIFIKVTQEIGSVREPDRLASWVVAVAINTVYKEIRKRHVRRLFQRDPHSVPMASTVEVDHEGRDLLRKTYEILNRIAPKDRLAFTLRYIDERPVPEIAELCGWSLATVKRRIARARERFEYFAAKDQALAGRLGLGWNEGREGDARVPAPGEDVKEWKA